MHNHHWSNSDTSHAEVAKNIEMRRERLYNLIEGMELTDLVTFYDYISSLTYMDENDIRTSLGAMVGHSVAVFRMTHKTCVCGNVHDADILDKTRDAMAAEGKIMIVGADENVDDVIAREMAKMRAEMDNVKVPTPGEELEREILKSPEEVLKESDGDQPSLFSDEPDPTPPPVQVVTEEREYSAGSQELLKEYNVKPHGEFPKVKCRGCGLEYPSLRDRMMKRPDGCGGCHIKSAHG